MKSLPGSQLLLGEISPKLVAGILGRSYDATPCLARSGSWFWRSGSWWWCRPRPLTSSLLLCSPRFLSASALPYSSSFCSLVLLIVSFFFFCLFSLPPPFLPPLHWLRGGAAALVGSQWRLRHCRRRWQCGRAVPPTLLPLLLLYPLVFFLYCPAPPPFPPLFPVSFVPSLRFCFPPYFLLTVTSPPPSFSHVLPLSVFFPLLHCPLSHSHCLFFLLF